MAELLLSRWPIGGCNCGRPIMRTPVRFLWVVNLRFSLCEIYVQNQWGHDYRSDRMLICVLILICETSCEKPIYFFLGFDCPWVRGGKAVFTSKISYSLIEPQLLSYLPACGHRFHALTVYLHATFKTHPIGGAFGIQLNIWGGGLFCQNSVLKPLIILGEELHRDEESEEKPSNTGAKQGNFRLSLFINSPDLHDQK